MSVIPQRTMRVLREMARTIFDEGSGVPEERLDYVAAELPKLLATVGGLVRFLVRLSIGFLQYAPLLVLGKPRRFTGLRPADRIRYLEKVETGLFGVMFIAVKLYLCLVYFEHPDGEALTGYDGRPLRPRAPAAAGIAQGEALSARGVAS